MRSMITYDFESAVRAADAALEAKRATCELIDSCLTACIALTEDAPIGRYIEMHSRCMALLVALKKLLENRRDTEDLNIAFRRARAQEMVVPRLYVTLVVACASQQEALLHTVAAMMSGVANPARGMLLRFTAGTLFPNKDQNLFIRFSLSNFQEMLCMVPKFLEAHKEAVEDVCGWLTASVSMGLYFNNNVFIERVFSMANQFKVERVSVAVIGEIVRSVQLEELRALFPRIASYLKSAECNETTKDIVIQCISRCVDPAEALSFAVDTPFAEEMGLRIAEKAMEIGDMGTLRAALARWRGDDVHTEALTRLGTNEYAELVSDLPKGATMIRKFVKAVDQSTESKALRNILANELTDSDPELSDLLCQMIIRVEPSGDFVADVFGEPFVFVGKELIQYVCSIGMKAHLPFRVVVSFLERTSGHDTSVWLIDAFDRKLGDELVQRLIEKDGFARRYLISRLTCFEVGEEALEQLLRKCTSEEELAGFCVTAWKHRRFELLKCAMKHLLELDGEKETTEEQLSIYIRCLNLTAFVCESEDIFERGFVSSILTHIRSIVQHNKLFPAVTPVELSILRKILVAVKASQGLSYLASEVDALLSCL